MAAGVKSKRAKTDNDILNEEITIEDPKKKTDKEIERVDKKKSKLAKRKGSGGKIISIIVLVAVFAAIIGIIFFNVFGIRDKYLRSALNNIPIVKNLLPAEPEPTEGDEMAALPPEELIAKIDELNKQNAKLQKDLDSAKNLYSTQAAEIERLRVFENQQSQFKKDKEEFDRLIAMGDPKAYSTFYESILTDNKETLYGEASIEAVYESEVKQYIRKISAMDDGAAAAMLELLIPSDMNLVVQILTKLDNEKFGNIMNEMNTQNASSIIKMMLPTEPPQTPPPVQISESGDDGNDGAGTGSEEEPGPTMTP